MNNNWFLPFMVLFGDEGNMQQENGCSGCGWMLLGFAFVVLFAAICSSLTP
jgi:hypothetical protein